MPQQKGRASVQMASLGGDGDRTLKSLSQEGPSPRGGSHGHKGGVSGPFLARIHWLLEHLLEGDRVEGSSAPAHCPLSSSSPSAEAGALFCGISFPCYTLSCRWSGEGLEFMPPSLPPMPATGLGTYRPLRNVNTSLPLALAVLAEENRVTKPEVHQAQTETEPDSEGGLQGQEAWN